MTIITRDWSTTTPAPTSPPPAIVLDPIMEEMMNMVNWTELEARFWTSKFNGGWGIFSQTFWGWIWELRIEMMNMVNRTELEARALINMKKKGFPADSEEGSSHRACQWETLLLLWRSQSRRRRHTGTFIPWHKVKSESDSSEVIFVARVNIISFHSDQMLFANIFLSLQSFGFGVEVHPGHGQGWTQGFGNWYHRRHHHLHRHLPFIWPSSWSSSSVKPAL